MSDSTNVQPFDSPACTPDEAEAAASRQIAPAAANPFSPFPLFPFSPLDPLPTSLPTIASAIENMIHAADLTPLKIGRLLAETFYQNSPDLFHARTRKPVSLRALQKLLRENGPIPRSFSSLRQMIAAHFQEECLDLSESDALRLSWRARVELLRVQDPAEKARLARECLDAKWTTRTLVERIRACTPADARPNKAQPSTIARLLRQAERLQKELKAATEAEPAAAEAVSLLRTLEACVRDAKKIADAAHRALMDRVRAQSAAEKSAPPVVPSATKNPEHL